VPAEYEVDLFSLAGTTSAFQRQGLTVDTRVRRMMQVVTVTGQEGNPFDGGRAFFFSRRSCVNARCCMRPSRGRQNFRIAYLQGARARDLGVSAAPPFWLSGAISIFPRRTTPSILSLKVGRINLCFPRPSENW
jgi:hypothetical protein